MRVRGATTVADVPMPPLPSALVTLAQVKSHLRITTPDGHPDDADLVLKQHAAEFAVTRYVAKSDHGREQVLTWTDAEHTPYDVQAAILLTTAELWRFRGDDPGASSTAPGRDPEHDLSPVVLGLLRRLTDPVVR